MKRDSGMPAATCFAGAVCLLSGLPARFVCGGLYLLILLRAALLSAAEAE